MKRDELLADARPIGGGSICDSYRASWDGRTVFAKTYDRPPPGFFAAEAKGLNWLAEADAPVPEVVHCDDEMLVLDWIDEGSPSGAAATALGRALARVHRCGADRFGADWQGYIGELPLDNTPSDSWPEFYAEQRVRPYLRMARDRGAVGEGDARSIERALDRVEELAGPPEPPSRIHGDLWSGNVVWGRDGAWLVDPAAHGGHRETDLAMLELFGCPQLDAIRSAYDEEYPLSDGWRERQPLHQLHPLLVHAALFGGGYGARAAAAARHYAGSKT